MTLGKVFVLFLAVVCFRYVLEIFHLRLRPVRAWLLACLFVAMIILAAWGITWLLGLI